MKKTTLRDVAEYAGLSVGIISKYINDKNVSKKNIDKISNAIKQLNYIPNPLARNLARGKSYTILLYIVGEMPIVTSTWLHTLPIIQGISDFLNNTEYRLEIEISNILDDEENNKKIVNYTSNNSIDGLIMLSPWKIKCELLNYLDTKDFPYIIVGSHLHIHKSVDFDNYTPIHDIIKTQYEKGCRKFGMIAGFKEQYHMQVRVESFKAVLKDYSLKCDEIKYGDYSMKSGFELTKAFFEEANVPTMIMCGNDYVAAGAIKAIKSYGLRVPDDICVSGFDATIVSEASNPTITTVKIPAYDCGRIAMNELFEKIIIPEYHISNILLECENLYQESTSSIFKSQFLGE